MLKIMQKGKMKNVMLEIIVDIYIDNCCSRIRGYKASNGSAKGDILCEERVFRRKPVG